jgi:hypothetical protein
MLAERFGACAVAEKLTRHNCTCSEAFQVPLRRAGNGSSKSLMPNVRLRSAEANSLRCNSATSELRSSTGFTSF